MILNERLNLIKPSPTIAMAMEARRLKEEGIDVIGLGIGEPDFDTADNVKEAGIKAIKSGDTKYPPVDGTKALKSAIIQKFKRENNIEYDLDEIIVSAGAKKTIYTAMFATLNPGDEVIIPSPYWVSYADIVTMNGGNNVIFETSSDSDFKLKGYELEKLITPKTKWLILNSPGNPTGSVYSKDELMEIGEVLRKYPHVYVMSDDIYEHIIYDGQRFYTLAEICPDLKERVLTVNGVSKAYAMTGWRIGYAGGPKEIIKAMMKVQSQTTSGVCSIAQAASVEALTGDQTYLINRARVFCERRDKVHQLLNDMNGITCRKPGGAFYLFPSCKELIGRKTPSGGIINDDKDFGSYLLKEAKVAIVPGSAFGYEGHFRVSYATDLDTLIEACKRIREACGKL